MSVYRNVGVVSFVLAGLVAACTASVSGSDGRVGAESEESGLGRIHLPTCQPVTGAPDGVIVQLSGLSRTRGAFCPTIGGRPGSFTDRYIAWEQGNISYCVGGCQGVPVRNRVPAEYGSEWADPGLTDPTATYCMWLVEPGDTYRQLWSDVYTAVESMSPGSLGGAWPHYRGSIDGCTSDTQPGQGSCTGCGGPKY